MSIQWLTTALTVAAFAACLYMWSSAEMLPERWHRLFRLGSWGAIIGAPVGAGAHLALGLGGHGRWYELGTLGDPSHRLGVMAGALVGSTIVLRAAHLGYRDALHMAFACLSPYLLGHWVVTLLGRNAYAFLMLDAWEAPTAYVDHVEHELAKLHLALALLGGAGFSLAFAGRVWRIWSSALPEELELLAWPPLELEADVDEREARA
ncbi:MAG: hypothetical protein AB7Y46_14715 [Armatimonadota bacterium]